MVKQVHNINDNEYLRNDGRNLAAFLQRLKNHHGEHYRRIVKTIRLVAPFFGDFHLRPTVGNKEKIQLEWTEQGQDEPFTASALSDGTLRFICLATVLLQPEQFMPAAILIDEPELGLHPFAITVLAGLMKSASRKRQLIVSTQSVELVSEFDAEDLIVVDKLRRRLHLQAPRCRGAVRVAGGVQPRRTVEKEPAWREAGAMIRSLPARGRPDGRSLCQRNAGSSLRADEYLPDAHHRQHQPWPPGWDRQLRQG